MKLSLCGWGQMLWKLKCCNQTQISICLYGITLLLQIRVCDSRCCECNSRLLVLCIPMKYLPISSIQMYRVRSEAAFFVVFCFVFIILFGREWNLHLQGEGSFPAVLLSLLAFTLWKCCDNRWWVRGGKPFPTNSWCLNEVMFENIYLRMPSSLCWKKLTFKQHVAQEFYVALLHSGSLPRQAWL